jgi:hypothetical protein
MGSSGGELTLYFSGRLRTPRAISFLSISVCNAMSHRQDEFSANCEFAGGGGFFNLGPYRWAHWRGSGNA